MDKYYIYNIESGDKVSVSKDCYNSYMKIIKSCTPKLNNKKIGRIFITGTGAKE